MSVAILLVLFALLAELLTIAVVFGPTPEDEYLSFVQKHWPKSDRLHRGWQALILKTAHVLCDGVERAEHSPVKGKRDAALRRLRRDSRQAILQIERDPGSYDPLSVAMAVTYYGALTYVCPP